MDVIISWASLVFSGGALLVSIFTYFANLQHNKKDDTLKAFNILQNEVFDKINLYSIKEIEEIVKDTRSEEYKTISGYVARLEHFCVGVREKIYDKKTLYSLAHGYMDEGTLRKRIDIIIEKKQKNAKEDYYENIHWVLNWMNEYRQKRRK